MPQPNKKTWIEISRGALEHNLDVFRGHLQPTTKLWAVVKSNAYGHGLQTFSQLANELGVDGFCVDSVIEALKLREDGITKPILVLGPTLTDTMQQAAAADVTVSVASLEACQQLVAAFPNPTDRPALHIKIDTGMHRQGVYLEDLPALIAYLKEQSLNVTGIFSHFASAKDINYPTYTERQFEVFTRASKLFAEAGFTNLTRHIAATGGTILNQKYHLDAVRIGIGLYGLYPSKELELQLADKLPLRPVLSWYSIISETKQVAAGEYIGYDLVERTHRPTNLAVVPIGYWHGFARALSSIGEVLARGKRARVLGRVSMDLITIDITDTGGASGDVVTLIGGELTAEEMARHMSASPYEVITRINPLIERVLAA